MTPRACLIDRTHGRASSKVTSDIGPMLPGRWHTWHLAWKIGATSLLNVTSAPAVPWARAASGVAKEKPATRAPTPITCHRPNRVMTDSFPA